MNSQVIHTDCHDCGNFDDCIFYFDAWHCPDCFIESVDVDVMAWRKHAKEA